MARFHFLPTDSYTMCGQPITHRSRGAAIFSDWLDHYDRRDGSACMQCRSACMRFTRFSLAIASRDRLHVRCFGSEVTGSPAFGQ